MSLPPLTDGERLDVVDRMIVSPASGIFEPMAPTHQAGTARVEAGEVIGHVRSGTQRVEVLSPFAGVPQKFFAWPSERVQQYQPVLWLHAT